MNNSIIYPGAGILYMKVGTHADEPLDEILARKRKEIADAGFGMWGYGGNTCHPTTMVQPFANDFEMRGETIHLCMEPMNSKHFASPVRADQYSADGREWVDIPSGINPWGSRYALLIETLEDVAFELSLSSTKVAVGRSQGRRGDEYIKGQSDKACFEITAPPHGINASDESVKKIKLAAKLREPYAVFLRNKP